MKYPRTRKQCARHLTSMCPAHCFCAVLSLPMLCRANRKPQGKSAHNETCDFYAHMGAHRCAPLRKALLSLCRKYRNNISGIISKSYRAINDSYFTALSACDIINIHKESAQRTLHLTTEKERKKWVIVIYCGRS